MALKVHYAVVYTETDTKYISSGCRSSSEEQIEVPVRKELYSAGTFEDCEAWLYAISEALTIVNQIRTEYYAAHRVFHALQKRSLNDCNIFEAARTKGNQAESEFRATFGHVELDSLNEYEIVKKYVYES